MPAAARKGLGIRLSLTLAFSLVSHGGRRIIDLYTRAPDLSPIFSPCPYRKGLGTKLDCYKSGY